MTQGYAHLVGTAMLSKAHSSVRNFAASLFAAYLAFLNQLL